jgi:hypothetical protein
MHDGDRRGISQQRREEIPAGHGRIVERDALPGHEKRALEGAVGQRLRADLLGLSCSRCRPRSAALMQRCQSAGDGEGE